MEQNLDYSFCQLVKVPTKYRGLEAEYRVALYNFLMAEKVKIESFWGHKLESQDILLLKRREIMNCSPHLKSCHWKC